MLIPHHIPHVSHRPIYTQVEELSLPVNPFTNSRETDIVPSLVERTESVPTPRQFPTNKIKLMFSPIPGSSDKTTVNSPDLNIEPALLDEAFLPESLHE